MSLLPSITSSHPDIWVGIYSSQEKLIPLQSQSRIDHARWRNWRPHCTGVIDSVWGFRAAVGHVDMLWPGGGCQIHIRSACAVLTHLFPWNSCLCFRRTRNTVKVVSSHIPTCFFCRFRPKHDSYPLKTSISQPSCVPVMVWLRRHSNSHAHWKKPQSQTFCFTTWQHRVRQVYVCGMLLDQRDQKILLAFDPPDWYWLQDSRCEGLRGRILQLQHKWLRKVFPSDPYLISTPYGESSLPLSTFAFLTRGMLRFSV